MKPINLIVLCVLLAFAIVLSGCSTSGMFTAGNLTEVQLQKGNFKILARGVSGESSAGYVLGFTMPLGMATNTFAIARVDGSGKLYKDALDDLWKNYQTAHGSAEGKKLALINVHYDSDALNLIFYTKATVTVRADVVEFTE
jgi:hypothetical protein